MQSYFTSLAYMVFSYLIALNYSAMWEVGVKLGAAITFLLASAHMVYKIRGQILDNQIKSNMLESEK